MVNMTPGLHIPKTYDYGVDKRETWDFVYGECWFRFRIWIASASDSFGWLTLHRHEEVSLDDPS